MFLDRFLNFRSFQNFWGATAVLLAFIWVRYLAEPKRTAAAVGLTRLRGLRALLMLSVGWYLIWAGAQVLRYFLQRAGG